MEKIKFTRPPKDESLLTLMDRVLCPQDVCGAGEDS